jgi:archaemetzincin
MNKSFFFILALFVTLTSCDHVGQQQKLKSSPTKDIYSKLGTINILPLGEVNSNIIEELKTTITNFYGRPVQILPKVKISEKVKRTPNSRYSADSILKYYGSSDQTVIITNYDITIFNEKKGMDWGIFGYGNLPGKTCVVSVYKRRLGKNISQKVLLSRLRKVAIHEVGHNLGLEHCQKDILCVMHAADGKASQVDREKEGFCDNCIKILQRLM